MSDDKATYACNTLPRFWVSIYLTVTIGMGTTFTLLALGVPPVVITPLFFVALFVSLTFFLKKSGFEMNETGVTERLMPYLEIIPGKTITKQYTWSQIKSYLLDENWNRSMGMQKYLKISFPGYQMAIWEGRTEAEKQAFQKLSDYFLAHAPQEKAKKSFYDKPLAKVLALFFVVVTGVFIVLVALDMMTPSGFLKLGFVIIPGTLLFLNRVFRKQAK